MAKKRKKPGRGYVTPQAPEAVAAPSEDASAPEPAPSWPAAARVPHIIPPLTDMEAAVLDEMAREHFSTSGPCVLAADADTFFNFGAIDEEVRDGPPRVLGLILRRAYQAGWIMRSHARNPPEVVYSTPPEPPAPPPHAPPSPDPFDELLDAPGDLAELLPHRIG
jgi:hypothetical protein